MTHPFDKGYWESHWQQGTEHGAVRPVEPNPYLADEITGLAPGSALDAGCGEGAEAIWLSQAGWQVTAADISNQALAVAATRARTVGVQAPTVRWVEADLSSWEPGEQFDLVTTHYAHPTMPQVAFYQRISRWVAPGGTLLIVGHLSHPDSGHGHGHSQGEHDHGQPPESASVTAAGIAGGLDSAEWDIATAAEQVRTLPDRSDDAGRVVTLHDVVVRATRRP